MKHIVRFIKFIVWTVALSYFVIIVLTHVPAFQQELGRKLSSLVSQQIGSYCEIGSVNLGFLNRVVIDDVVIRDKKRVDMLRAKRVAVTPDFYDILQGKITITAAQLFGADVCLYKDTEDSPLNCQFAIDALSDKDSKEPSKLDLRINSLILRNSRVSYDLNYKPLRPKSIIDVNHISVSKLSAHLFLSELKEKDIELEIKKLAFAEKNGLTANDLRCELSMHNDILKVKALELTLSDGHLNSDSIVCNLAKKSLYGDIDARYKELSATAALIGSDKEIVVRNLNLSNEARTLRLRGQAEVGFGGQESSLSWRADISDFAVETAVLRHTIYETLRLETGELPKQLTDAGYINFKGSTEGMLTEGFKNDPLNCIFGNIVGEASSALGDITLDVTKSKEQLKAAVYADNLKLGTILSDPRFNTFSGDIDLTLPSSFLSTIANNAIANGSLAIDRLLPSSCQLLADIRHFDFDGRSFSDIKADLSLANSILKGTLSSAPGNIAAFDAAIDLNISHINDKKLLGLLEINNLQYDKFALNRITADFKEGQADIQTDFASLSFTGDIAKKNINSLIHLDDIAEVDRMLKLGLNAKGEVDAVLNLRGDTISGTVKSPQLAVSSVEAYGVGIRFDMHGQTIRSHITADNGSKKDNLRVALNSSVTLQKNESGKISGADVHLLPSQVFLNDRLFAVSESDISYNGAALSIDQLAIRHGQQHVIINGKAMKHTNDSIVIDINDLDIPYILDFVKFDAVDFEGKASGYAVVRKLLDKPEASANLVVEDFKFEQGRMGTLHANAYWNDADSQIDIDAYSDDEGRITKIDGYVSPARNYMDLGIKAIGTRGEFVTNYCRSFLSNADLSIDGECHVWGDLRFINLTGVARATGRFHVNALGTDYEIKDQLVEFVPNDIIFLNDTVTDKYGRHGIVTGALHHQYLSRLTYDVNVTARNLLSYDFPTYGNEVFFGKAFMTGNCEIIGRPGNITFNVNGRTERGSFIEYNATNPDAITGQQFINWRNRTPGKTGSLSLDDADNDYSSDIRLNINAAVDTRSTLRVLMDSHSGDMITLNGSGNLRCTYYNKGKFELYGTYAVESGQYNMTIQNLLQKNFQFQSGSQIVFGGEPYDASLALKAKYPVNGVPLSDLQIGNSFKNNNVHVDCLMDITGTPAKPVVDFDFDLPTVNADAKAMIHSVINSEQEKNQQVVYLLAIGRFYSQETAASAGNEAERQSQASLAMQSFISGTVSQQINNALGSVAKSNNWNIGANISPGDEGLNNAEYEGVLSGSLLNNRLLINGQFGYRDNPNATSSFIGDFDVRYLLVPSGNIAVRVYNQTNDRYFTRSSLNTQGLGLIFKYDFQHFMPLWRKKDETQKDIKKLRNSVKVPK